jgi:hypothetical protein
MAGGKPRTVSFSKEKMIELGEEMIAWLEEHPDTLHLSEWYTIVKMFSHKQWECFERVPEFLPYYDKAIKMIGIKYLNKNSNVREGISQRWQRMYFDDIRKREDEEHDRKLQKELEQKKQLIEIEARAKAQSIVTATPEILSQFGAFMQQLAMAQSVFRGSSSQLSIETNNQSTDSKS